MFGQAQNSETLIPSSINVSRISNTHVWSSTSTSIGPITDRLAPALQVPVIGGATAATARRKRSCPFFLRIQRGIVLQFVNQPKLRGAKELHQIVAPIDAGRFHFARL